jgi:hypothetical protein
MSCNLPETLLFMDHIITMYILQITVNHLHHPDEFSPSKVCNVHEICIFTPAWFKNIPITYFLITCVENDFPYLTWIFLALLSRVLSIHAPSMKCICPNLSSHSIKILWHKYWLYFQHIISYKMIISNFKIFCVCSSFWRMTISRPNLDLTYNIMHTLTNIMSFHRRANGKYS